LGFLLEMQNDHREYLELELLEEYYPLQIFEIVRKCLLDLLHHLMLQLDPKPRQEKLLEYFLNPLHLLQLKLYLKKLNCLH
tara:strand:+ start:334 stop:576 length:243 start_codon:yes stop_codon:yes gene_type:complete